MNRPLHDCSFRIATSQSSAPSAIAVIDFFAPTSESIDAAAKFLSGTTIAVGEIKLHTIADIDQGLIARWDDLHLSLMPHAGPHIIRRIAEHLAASGAALVDEAAAHPRDLYPEASDVFEACMLATLARAASPLAVDALLAQPDRWRTAARRANDIESRALNRLIDPPLVVAVGPPNVGKSSLTNALAHRSVSIVSPEAGTTRDHVGVTLNLAGLVVRWIDTPGLRDIPSDPIEQRSLELARRTIAQADLVVTCGDLAHPFVLAQALPLHPNSILIRCATRSDLGLPTAPFDVTTSATTAQGLDSLSALIRDLLVPPSLLKDPVAWPFHPRLLDLVPDPHSGDTL